MDTLTNVKKEKELWEEKNSTEPEKNCLCNNEQEQNDTTKLIKSESTPNECQNIIPTNNVYYVYVIKNPLDNSIFYVGKGKGRRCNVHIRYAELNDTPKKGYNSIYLFRKIKKLLNDGVMPIVEKVFENLSERDALIKEQELIEKYRQAYKLCNLTNGGEGVSGLKFSNESRRKLSEMRRGHKMNERTRIALRNANLGRKMKPEWVHKQKLMWSNRTYYIKNHNTGEEFVTRLLKPFCRERALKDNTMMQSFKCKRKTLSGANAGWELYKVELDIPNFPKEPLPSRL